MATKKKQTKNNDKPCLEATPRKMAKKSSDDLRKPQVRVLQALAKSKTALSRAEIATKGDVDLAMLNSYIGANDVKIRAKNDKAACKSLLTRGYVKASDGDGAASNSITAAGRKALATK